ncbi:hypothetical protein C8F01DRAFT_1237254 [Mycena amicta]|nr:hypothetical protein C8F01DRAFT_1237254 [Mycena amicta]
MKQATVLMKEGGVQFTEDLASLGSRVYRTTAGGNKHGGGFGDPGRWYGNGNSLGGLGEVPQWDGDQRRSVWGDGKAWQRQKRGTAWSARLGEASGKVGRGRRGSECGGECVVQNNKGGYCKKSGSWAYLSPETQGSSSERRAVYQPPLPARGEPRQGKDSNESQGQRELAPDSASSADTGRAIRAGRSEGIDRALTRWKFSPMSCGTDTGLNSAYVCLPWPNLNEDFNRNHGQREPVPDNVLGHVLSTTPTLLPIPRGKGHREIVALAGTVEGCKARPSCARPGDRENPEYDYARSSTGHPSLKKRAAELSPNKFPPCPQKTESDGSVRSAQSLKSPCLSRNSLPRARPLLESPAKARKVSVAASDADDESDTSLSRSQTIQPFSFDSNQGDSDRDDHGPEATPRKRRTKSSVPVPATPTHREKSLALTGGPSSPPPDTPGPFPDNDIPDNDVDVDMDLPTPLAYDRITVLATAPTHRDLYPYALASRVDLGTLAADSIPFQFNPGNWPVPYMPLNHALENASADDIAEVKAAEDCTFLAVVFHGGYDSLAGNAQSIGGRLMDTLTPLIPRDLGSIASIRLPTPKSRAVQDRFAGPFTFVGRTSNKETRDSLTKFFTIPLDEQLAVHVINPSDSALSWNIVHTNCDAVVGDVDILLNALRYAAFKLITTDIAGLPLRNIIGAAKQGDSTRMSAQHVHDAASSLFAVLVPHDQRPFLMLCGRPFTSNVEFWEQFCAILRSLVLRDDGFTFEPHGYKSDHPDRILPRPICKMCKMDTHKEYMCPFSQSTFAWRGPRLSVQEMAAPAVAVLPTGLYTVVQRGGRGGRGGRGARGTRAGRGPYGRGRGR